MHCAFIMQYFHPCTAACLQMSQTGARFLPPAGLTDQQEHFSFNLHQKLYWLLYTLVCWLHSSLPLRHNQTSLDLAAGGGQDFAPSSSTTRARCPAPQAWARQGSRAAAPRPTRDRAFPSSGSSARSCWAPPTAGDVKLSSYHCAASASRRGEDFSVLQQ